MAAFESIAAIDLTTVGNYADVDVSGADQVTIVARDGLTWGSGVVEVRRVVGGEEVAYSPAKELDATDRVLDALSVEDVSVLRLVVTTAGNGFGRVAMAGKVRDASGRVVGGGAP